MLLFFTGKMDDVWQLSEYIIPFVGLKDGKHVFTYEIDKHFFSLFDVSPIKEGDIYVHLTFDKKPGLFILDFFVDGSFISECDRCLEPVELPVNGNYRLFIKFNDTDLDMPLNEESDIVFISSSEVSIDISQHIYEYINLSTPIQKTCDMSVIQFKKCDEEVIKLLNSTPSEEDGEIDPRWDLLKNIKDS